VKHIRNVTRVPGKANAIQEILCQVNQFLVTLLGALGGASPLAGFVAAKCDLPNPQ